MIMKAQRNGKQKIVDALIEIMKTKDISKITVKELILQAQVNRSTYYYYFYHIEEIIEYIMDSFLEQMVPVVEHNENIILNRESRDRNYIEHKTVRFYEFILAHLDEYKSIIRSKYKNVFYEKIVQVMQEPYKDYTHMYRKKGDFVKMSDRERQYWDYQATWVFVGVLECWSKRGFEETPEELIQLTYELFGSTEVLIEMR